MTISVQIKDFLEKEQISYEVLEHRVTYTASETAQAQHLPGHQFVKSVIVNGDDQWILCVLPATHKVDFEKLKFTFSLNQVFLADEGDVAVLFPECDLGAMPPFGQLAKVPISVCVDVGLQENETIAFNAGTHTEIIKLKFKDYLHITKPVWGDFSVHI